MNILTSSKSIGLLFLIVLGLVSCKNDNDPENPNPIITKIEPATGTSGDLITIYGTGLSTNDCKVFFSNQWYQLKPDREATIVENISGGIRVKVPEEPFVTNLKIYVIRRENSSDSVAFKFISKRWERLNFSFGNGSVSFAIGNIGYFIVGPRVYSFNTETHQITKLNDFSAAITGSLSTAFSWNNKGYIVLDSYPIQIWEYDPTSDSWAFKTKGPIQQLYEGFSFVIDTRAYIGGGQNNAGLQQQREVYAYNLVNNSWTQVSDYPGISGNGVSTTVVNGLSYCFGGGLNFLLPLGSSYPGSNGNWSYNPQLNTWTKLANIPDNNQWLADRSYGTILSTTDKIYWGIGRSSSSGIEMNYIYEYSIAENSWKLHNIIPDDWYGGSYFTGFQFNGKGYYSNNFNQDFWIFNP